MLCPKCNVEMREIDDDTFFCPYCGLRIDKNQKIDAADLNMPSQKVAKARKNIDDFANPTKYGSLTIFLWIMEVLFTIIILVSNSINTIYILSALNIFVQIAATFCLVKWISANTAVNVIKEYHNQYINDIQKSNDTAISEIAKLKDRIAALEQTVESLKNNN